VTDIAGLIRGASEGAGLGNNFLSHIQAVDGIYHVVRVFEDEEIVHVDDSIDAIRDLETIQSELCKKDLEFVKKAIQFEELAIKKSGGKFKLSPNFISVTTKLVEMLEDNKPVRMGEWTNSDIELINEKMQLITTKPTTYLANMSKADIIRKKNKWLPKIHQWIQKHGGGVLVPFSVEFEQGLWNLREDKAAQDAFMEESKTTSALPKMIQTGYSELNLIYYFTAGEKEVRAWTVYEGATAPEAASVIHTDFGKAFIKAEVVSYADFKEFTDGTKGMAAIKAAGKYRQEGKTYIVKDGDIIYFQIGTMQKKK
jgi:GTP-binding protein YchF